MEAGRRPAHLLAWTLTFSPRFLSQAVQQKLLEFQVNGGNHFILNPWPSGRFLITNTVGVICGCALGMG